jgi:FMN reductase
LSRILSLLGSPSARSRSGALLAQLEARLETALDDDGAVARVALRELPAEALLLGHSAQPAVAAAAAAVRHASLILIATPIYKAAYSGLLKSFLDLLPTDALRGKTIVPLATGGSPAHFLALDYALKPVLAALGARDIRDAVYATEAQLVDDAGAYVPTIDLQQRLDRALSDLIGPQRTLDLHAASPLLPSHTEPRALRCTA